MNKGSTRVTVRLGDDCIDRIKTVCVELNERHDAKREWNMTEFIIQAIVEKLDKIQRGRRAEVGHSLEKVNEYKPREWQEPGS